jgi:hypothetical protein
MGEEEQRPIIKQNIASASDRMPELLNWNYKKNIKRLNH